MISDLVTLILGLQRYTFNDKLKILFEIFLARKSEKSGSPKEAAFCAEKCGNSITVSRLLVFFFHFSFLPV
jgi:hypothetical protein